MGLFDGLFKKKGIPEKITFFGQEYEINPDALVFSQKGLDDYYQTRDYSGAVINFTKAINAQPSNSNFYTMRGTAYEEMNNDNEAAKDFKKAIDLSSKNYVAAYRLGMVYFRKKDLESAAQWLKVSYENAVDGDLSFAGIGNNNIMFVHKKIITGNLGNFLTQMKRYDEGFRYLDDAIQLDPEYANPYMTKGLQLFQIGKHQEALEYIKKAAEFGDSKAPEVYETLRQFLNKQSKPISANPLNISNDSQLNAFHKLPNLIDNFASDLFNYFEQLQDRNGNITIQQFITLTVYYSLRLMIEYRNKGELNILPSSIIEDIKYQVLKAAQIHFDAFSQQEVVDIMFSQIDSKIYDLNVVFETLNYMEKFEN